MNELTAMNKEIRFYTLIAAAILSTIGWFAFPVEGKQIAVGVLVGALCGLIGFQMIIQSAGSLEADTKNPKAKAYRAYLLRYLVYAAIFVLAVKSGVNVIALLIGMLAHKACILLYTYRHRKEDD